MISNKNPLIDSGLAITAITAFLYCAGTAYSGGYNRTLGLDGDVLDRNIQQVLYDGFFLSFAPLITFFFIYAMYRFIISHAVIPITKEEIKGKFKKKRMLIKIKHRLFGKRKDSNTEKTARAHTRSALGLVVLSIAFLSSLIHFETQGKEKALLTIKTIDNNEFSPNQIITKNIHGKEKKLFLLNCGATNCAAIDPKNKIIEYFPNSNFSYPLGLEAQTKKSTSSS